MKCTGKAKLLNVVVEQNRTVGKIYFATNVAPKGEEPDFETDFCNMVAVGKAHKMIKELEKFEDLEKMPLFITESQLRLKSGQRADGTFWTYNEIVIFDFEEVEQQEQPKPKQQKGKKSYQRRR